VVLRECNDSYKSASIEVLLHEFMARRNRQIVSSDSEPSSPSLPAPLSQPDADTQASNLQDREVFNLDNVSGSDSDHSRPATATTPGEINDPGAPTLPKTAAADIRYFFDKTGEKAVCNECR